MATPIADTPVLEGKDAREFWKEQEEDSKRLPLTPTPDLDKLRKQMLADDKRRKE